MKCKYCGGDVSLNDHFCPHCGRPVDQAQRHQKEMRQYETEFEETKKEAMDKIAVSSGGGTAVGIRLAAIVVLIVAIAWMALNLNNYSINERREKRAAKKNYDAYVAQMETYLDDRDYSALSVFCDQHMLDYNEDYRQYREIIYGADAYRYVYRGVLEVAYATEDTRNLYYAEELSKNVNRFYEQVNSDSYLRYSKDPDRTTAVYEEMEKDLQILLQRYLGLTDEEAAALKNLSKSKRTVLIEEYLDKQIVSKTGRGLSEIRETELPKVGTTQEGE